MMFQKHVNTYMEIKLHTQLSFQLAPLLYFIYVYIAYFVI